MPRYLLVWLSLIFLVCPANASDPEDPAFKGLRDRWAAAMKTLRVPGLAVVVVRDDQVILLESLGIRDPEGAKPVTPDTYFYIASCTKPYTAAVIAQLVEAGKLDLNAPVKRYLPRFQLADAVAAEKMTLRDLLCHRPSLGSFPVVFLDAYTGEITDDRYYHFLQRTKPRGQVGYSNIHFTLLGRVIEAAEGKGWREAMDDRLFKPAGMMRTTGYASKMYADADVALPLEESGDGFALCPVRKNDRTMHAAGGLGTTARDLSRWLHLNTNGGRLDGTSILSPAMLKEMTTRQSETARNYAHPDLKTDGFGLGWQLGTYKGNRLATHGGGYTGAAAHVSFLPEKKLGVAVLSNSSGAAGAFVEIVAYDVYDRLLGSTTPDMIPKFIEANERNRSRRTTTATATPPADGAGLTLPAAAYAGVFHNDHWGTFRIEIKDGKLHARHGDLATPLKTTGPDRFQLAIDPRTWRDGSFELKDGQVTAVSIFWNDYGTARFERKQP